MSIFSVPSNDVVIASNNIAISIDSSENVTLTSTLVFNDTTNGSSASLPSATITLTATQVTAIINALTPVLEGILATPPTIS